MNLLKYSFLAFFLSISMATFAQQQLKQKIDMTIDKYGNANIKVTSKMDAAGWQRWVATIGNNPSALKREMEKGMPGYFLDSFKLEKNDMERSYELKLKAFGVCKVNKKGKWILETDDKDVDLTELTERKFMYVNSPIEFGGQLQQTTIVEFPEEALEIKVDEDAYGKTIFKFDMVREVKKAGFNLLTASGIFLILVGLGWLVRNMMVKS